MISRVTVSIAADARVSVTSRTAKLIRVVRGATASGGITTDALVQRMYPDGHLHTDKPDRSLHASICKLNATVLRPLGYEISCSGWGGVYKLRRYE